jgi:HEAT repeat protein
VNVAGPLRRGFQPLCCAAALSVGAVGCHSWPIDFDSPADKTAEKPAHGPDERRADHDQRPATADKFALLSDPYWVAAPADQSDPIAAAVATAKRRARGEVEASTHPIAQQSTPQRWRHQGVEKFIAAHADQAERLGEIRAAAASSNSTIATNAAILLGRDGHSEAMKPLVRAIQSSNTNPWQRRAAIEALADIDDVSIVPRLQQLIDEQCSALGRTNGHGAYLGEVHADLLDALARVERRQNDDSSTAGEPRFAAALSSPAAIVRRAGLLALANPATGALPADISHYAADEDRQVRQAALITIAARRRPDALDAMRRGLADRDLDARLAAIAGLGLIGEANPDAKAELKQLATNQSELIRAAAYSPLLDTSDDHEQLAAAAADKSWRVRRIAAAALARHADRRSAALAERLVGDGNADVAAQMIKSLESWPLESAGPVLFKAMEGLSFMPRKFAAEQLARRWPPAKSYEVNATTDRRGQLVADLQQKWQATFGANKTFAPEKKSDNEPDKRQLELAAVGRLATDDLSARRRAAEELRDRFAAKPLSSAALDRLAELISRENDALVWLPVFDLLATDAREPAMRLACTALGHPSPEVRRRACEHLAAHPDSAHGALLLVSLDDPDSVVVEAAVKALGRLDSLPDPNPLERLLASPNRELRVEAAKALTHAGAKSGIAALERLAFDADPQARRRAAVAMGETPDPSFVPDLIHMLDDRPEIRQAALASLPRVAGTEIPVAETAVKDRSPASEADRWKEWFRKESTLR